MWAAPIRTMELHLCNPHNFHVGSTDKFQMVDFSISRFEFEWSAAAIEVEQALPKTPYTGRSVCDQSALVCEGL